ncbi:MAG: hypothetical protein JWR18_3766 [Segetibacter sp.]|nr:hypothetical protein [Segetibacter sp.]
MNRKILNFICVVFGFIAIACNDSAIQPGNLTVSSLVQSADSIHLQSAGRIKKKSCCVAAPSRFRTTADAAKLESK